MQTFSVSMSFEETTIFMQLDVKTQKASPVLLSAQTLSSDC